MSKPEHCPFCDHPVDFHLGGGGCVGRFGLADAPCGCVRRPNQTGVDDEVRAKDPTMGAEVIREKLAAKGIGSSARDTQVGGEHYKKFKIQPWDVIDEYGLNFYEGNTLKYLLRRKSNRLEDLKKARHCLDRLIELEENAPE